MSAGASGLSQAETDALAKVRELLHGASHQLTVAVVDLAIDRMVARMEASIRVQSEDAPRRAWLLSTSQRVHTLRRGLRVELRHGAALVEGRI